MSTNVSWCAGLSFGIVLGVAVACGGTTNPPGENCPIKVTGPWVPFANPYADGGPNPAANIAGSVSGCPVDGGITVKLAVSGLPATRERFARAVIKEAFQDLNRVRQIAEMAKLQALAKRRGVSAAVVLRELVRNAASSNR